MAKANLNTSANIGVTAREIDFVSRFQNNWEHLQQILGIMRPIKKQPGTVLKSKSAKVTLVSGNVGEGEDIPYSKPDYTETPYAEMGVEKYAMGVSLEAIKDHGYEVAVGMADDAFLFELQTNVTGRFYDYIKTGTLRATAPTFQMALAMARGYVENKFKQMHRTATGFVGFANILDVYEYLGAANITVQTQFGFTYLKDFMGFGAIFMLSDNEIPRGKVLATANENLVLYYVAPSDSDFARAGLVYTVEGDTNLIGIHMQGNYNNAVSESFALMGMTLFAEYIDAIAVMTVNANPTLEALTVTSAAGSASGQTKLTVSPAKSAANTYRYKTHASTAPTVAYGDDVSGWTAWDGVSEITATGKITVVEADSAMKAVASGNATVTAAT